ncbi:MULTISPECIES: hypothetical protein [unclassified Pseudomonas]|uniref:hypothetical protein n=1 Tax=unclassified Pseudomonas TaxID=196821 RepID=UPI001B32CB27|nr:MULTISPECIES: hypothetical protein [unclassified Pseudomonas]MBP5943292.1 hypothetical protein [Pseudomonas sp. P9(2020)]MBZ9562207.1 hypothetical protein [Pseudomonas sp. P116]
MTSCYFALMQRHPFRKQGNTLPADSYAQPEIRVQQIEEMIKNAEVSITSESLPAPDVKIAICPEHFLARQHGKKIARPTDGRFFNEMHEVIPILQQLTLISRSRPDWLIIPGSITVFGLNPVKSGDLEKDILYTHDMLTKTNDAGHNATMQNIGLQKELDLTHSYLKKQGEQLLRPCYNIAPIYLAGTIIKIRRKKFEAYGEQGSLDLIGEGSEAGFFPMSDPKAVFEFKGLTIGVEICVEHEHGLLKSEAPDGLDLHILISNEVTPFTEHAALKANGALVHVDTNSTGVYRKNELVGASNPWDFIPKNHSVQKSHFVRQNVGVEDAIRLELGK